MGASCTIAAPRLFQSQGVRAALHGTPESRLGQREEQTVPARSGGAGMGGARLAIHSRYFRELGTATLVYPPPPQEVAVPEHMIIMEEAQHCTAPPTETAKPTR